MVVFHQCLPCYVITHTMQAEAVYSEVLHGRPEAKAQRLGVIVHFDVLSLSAAANKMCRPRTSVSLCPHMSVCFSTSGPPPLFSHANTPKLKKRDIQNYV